MNARLGERNAQNAARLVISRNVAGQTEKQTAYWNKEQAVRRRTTGHQTQSIL